MILPNTDLRNAIFGFCVAFAGTGFCVSSAFASDDALRVKGANVISLQVQTHHQISDFDLQVSFDGETYYACSVGLPRAWQLFFSIAQTARAATISVPVVAGFSSGVEEFALNEPGRHWFRWTVRYKDGAEPSVIDQEVEVLESSEADLAFIERLADPQFCRLMLGEKWYDQFIDPKRDYYSEPERRAVKVIGRLLYATRDKLAEGAMGTAGPQGDMEASGHALLELAKEFPDSSYAPYAAYYAGCCLTTTSKMSVREQAQKEVSEGRNEDVTERRRRKYAWLKDDPSSAKGKEAFLFAAERGDAYLMPRALYQAARHCKYRGELEETDALLTRAEVAVPGSGTVADWVKESRAVFNRNRPELERATAAEEKGSK